MKKDKILAILKEKCQTLCNEHQEGSKKRIYESIMNILNSPDAFSFIDAGTSLNILIDLGYSKNEAIKLYQTLIGWVYLQKKTPEFWCFFEYDIKSLTFSRIQMGSLAWWAICFLFQCHRKSFLRQEILKLKQERLQCFFPYTSFDRKVS